MIRFAGAVGDPCHVEAGVDFALGVRRARLQDLGFRRLCLQEADESGKADTTDKSRPRGIIHSCDFKNKYVPLIVSESRFCSSLNVQ